MTLIGAGQIGLFFIIILLATRPLGSYMARVFTGERTLLSPLLRPVERAFYVLLGVSEDDEMDWKAYTFALLLFSAVGLAVSYALLRSQGHLGYNPGHVGGKEMRPDLAFNTAASFTTNTNWQSYTPESTVSYLSNMVPLAIHNWMSAAAGIAVALALIRGLASRSATGIGSFWVDLTRATLYLLLPISLLYAVVLVQQGVPQNLHPFVVAKTLEGATQTIPQGAVASQECIKMLGTNGGGIFNANSAHPYENPTPLTNFLQVLSIFLIPAGLTYTFGKMAGNTKQGWVLFATMSLLFFAGVSVCTWQEQRGNPNVTRLGISAAPGGGQPGGNMEGKETRFGIVASALFTTVTTDASCGAVNTMHDSLTPLGGLVPLSNIMTGEVVFGGVGAGLYGMLMYAVLAVFIAGLMVGRTPEYLGKKIEQYEVKMAMLAVLVLAADILCFSALASNLNVPPGAHSVTITPAAQTTEAHLASSSAAWNHVNNSSPSLYEGATYNNTNNGGAHGLTEILYAYTSAAGNNGSAFAGISANTPFYNLTIGIAMLIGRFLMIVPLLAIAGSMARKKRLPESAGTFPTDSGTFVMVLTGTVVIVGALTFFPAIALGPLVEHLQMISGSLH